MIAGAGGVAGVEETGFFAKRCLRGLAGACTAGGGVVDDSAGAGEGVAAGAGAGMAAEGFRSGFMMLFF